MHGCWDEGVDFIFNPEVTPTIPEDVVGRSGVVWEFEVEFLGLALRMKSLRSWADSWVIERSSWLIRRPTS